MKDEYIIVNRIDIQKRIEELKMECENPSTQWHDRKAKSLEIISLQEILSQSTPLIPEIEKAYDAGTLDHQLSLSFDYPKGRYLSSLKLNL